MKLKFLIFVFLFLLVPKVAFAIDVVLTGSIIDSSNNPVPNGSLVFTNTSDNKTTSITADKNGNYEMSTTDGIYSIVVSGGDGSNLPQSKLENQNISSSSTRDFVLTSEKQKQPTGFVGIPNMYLFFGLILLGMLIVSIWVIKKRRKRVS